MLLHGYTHHHDYVTHTHLHTTSQCSFMLLHSADASNEFPLGFLLTTGQKQQYK